MRSTRAAAIKETAARLYKLRVEIAQEAAETEKKARRYNLLRDMTPKEAEKADALCMKQDALEEQLDAIDGALLSLSHFSVLK